MKLTSASSIKVHYKKICKSLDDEENILLQNIHFLRETNVEFVIIYRQYDANATNWTINIRQLDAFALMQNQDNKSLREFAVFFRKKLRWKSSNIFIKEIDKGVFRFFRQTLSNTMWLCPKSNRK